MNKVFRQTVLPLCSAMIWGSAFVFQRVSTDHLGPLTFNAVRGTIGAATLGLLLLVLRAARGGAARGDPRRSLRPLLRGGICCGAVLAVAATLQQAGLAGTSAGKTAFISALYIIIVPLVGKLFGKRQPTTLWIGVALSVAGLYLLCVGEAFTLSRSDGIVLLSAFCFAGHILVIDHFVAGQNPIALSCVQFVTQAALCGLAALLLETPSLGALRICAGSLLYVGVFSSGIAFTLQIVAQKGTDPAVVSILLGLESLFGAVFGALLLQESLSARELLGGALMLAATVFAQLPDRSARA